MRAGSTLLLCLRATDRYGNRHTMGGAVKAAVVWGAGRREQDSSSLGESRASRPGSDVVCDVSYTSGGSYDIKCRVYTKGTHSLTVSESSEGFSSPKELGKIRVLSSRPHASSCKLVDSKSFVGTVGKRHYIFMELFDQFGNWSWYRNSREANLAVKARVGHHPISMFSVNEILREGHSRVTPPPTCGPGRRSRFIVLVFIPEKVGVAMLHVRINDVPLPACPVTFTVRVSKTSLAAKVRALRAYLLGQHCRGYTPTLTMDRSRLLESAVSALNQEDYFSKVIRVRFGDERGIDMGGISRYDKATPLK